MQKVRLLLDANLSPETAIFLRKEGFNVKSLIEEAIGSIEDEEVVRIAKKEKRIIVTFDLDFGEIYYFAHEKRFGVIVLRLDDQRVENVNMALWNFLQSWQSKDIRKKLVILRETEVRVV